LLAEYIKEGKYMKEILERRSIRSYTGEEVTEEQVKKLLRAAMAAPSAGNGQPWEFIVIRDKQLFQKIMLIHPYSQMLKEASVAIAVCGNIHKEQFEGFWVQDCSAATENILLMAQHLGLGAVWLGVYPDRERVADIQKILGMPALVIPLNIISIGYPAERRAPEDRYKESRIHYNQW
jgi:nitroreductase